MSRLEKAKVLIIGLVVIVPCILHLGLKMRETNRHIEQLINHAKVLNRLHEQTLQARLELL